MKMQFFKHLFAVCAVSASFVAAHSQSIERQVIGSSGGSYTGGTFSADYTAGEVVTTTGAAGSVIVTQGFQQPPQVANGVKTIKTSDNVLVYPNPTGNLLKIEWKNSSFTGDVVLFDAAGREVWRGTKNSVALAEVDMSAFAPGIYSLQLLGSNQSVSVHRITKI